MIILKIIFYIAVAIAVFYFKPRTKKIIGLISTIVSAIVFIIVLLINSELQMLLNSEIIGTIAGFFIPNIDGSVLTLAIGWLLWSIGLYVSTIKFYPDLGKDGYLDKVSNLNMITSKANNEKSYIDENSIDNSFIDGFRYGGEIKKIYELVDIKAISKEEAEDRKNKKIDELIELNIPDSIEDFIIEVNRVVESLLTDEEKKKIYEICKIKKEFKYKNDEDLLQKVMTKGKCEELTKLIILAELKRRGYKSEALDEIRILENVDNIYLVDRYEKTGYKYLNLKLKENNIDGDEIVRYKKALKLNEREVITRYFEDLEVLRLEYNQWVEENKVSAKAKKGIDKVGKETNVFLKKSKNEGTKFFNIAKNNYLKNKVKWNVGIGAFVGIIAIIIGVNIYLGMKPSNSDIITYATKQVEAQNLKPEGMKVLTTNLDGKNSYVVNIQFKVKGTGYDTNYEDSVSYEYMSNEWHPIGVENISSNEIPTSALSESKATSLLMQQQIQGVSISENGLKLTNPNTNLENGTQSYNIAYNYKGNGYTIDFTGVANFTFANGQWGFDSFTNVNAKSNIKPLDKNDMISLFVGYENGQDSWGNSIVANECSIVSSSVDVATKSASATIAVTTSNGQGSDSNSVQNYNVSYTFNNTNPTSASWSVQTANTSGNATTVATAPSAGTLENLAAAAYIGGSGSDESFVSAVTVSNIKFNSNAQTATATVSGQYTDANGNTENGSFTGSFTFTNGQWTLGQINS
ncbi:MAG: hypothetical protein ACRC30_15300 [Clostridium sp.]